jgi:hypothetical protein
MKELSLRMNTALTIYYDLDLHLVKGGTTLHRSQ